ncbi:MAG TPA: carboxypeptidase regulatory-like domain-containing protein [Pyrinomonadaceae bacterium]|nr:carboxypeptidase regulatory-like domain-containing protein [Pyrinomonadaceae bacterium]
MRSKSFFRTIAAALLLAACSFVASAQTTQVSGKVTLKQADGTLLPVAGAQVDIYRTDIKGEYHVKTNKKGEYTHAGIPFVGTYTLIVSAPGARPTYATGLRFTTTQVADFTLEPGDGSKLTLEQLKTMGAATSGGGTAPAAPAAEGKEEKARREAFEKERAAIEEENKKISNANEIINRTFKAGNEAFNAKNYDAAIGFYNEGLAAREEPALYANKSVALRLRGAETFNKVINSSDQATKTAGLESAYKDWRDAVEAGKKAMDMMNALTVPTDPTGKTNYDKNKLAAITAYAEAMKLVGTKVDKSQAEAAFKAYTEFAAAELDPTKKPQRISEAAKIFFDAGDYNRAAEEYRKIVETDPENAEANLYLGFSLFNSGEKAKFQEAANYLGKFSEKAADTHPLKADVKSILEFLKTQENIKPERITPTRTTTGRRRG